MSFIKLCLFSICLLTASLAAGQTDSTKANGRTEKEDRPPSAFWERTRFGGNFALQLGFNTFIDVSPTLTHIVSDKVQVGGGLTFMYVRFTAFNPFTGAQVRQPGNSIFGGRVFSRFFPVSAVPQIFLQGELESLNVLYPRYNAATGDFDRVRGFVPGAFVGGGYFQGVNNRSGFTLSVLYNLLYEQNRMRSPYGSPWVIRAGFQL